MQNVTLPDRDEVRAVEIEVPPMLGVEGEEPLPTWRDVRYAVVRVVELEAFVRALYAKHGEVCPLFGPEEEE
jgi:hypothetical protein